VTQYGHCRDTLDSACTVAAMIMDLALTSSEDELNWDNVKRTYTLSETDRKHIVASIEAFRTSIGDFSLPSRHAITRYMVSFFEGFHSHLLFIHEPTFNPTTCPPELLLAICAAGAQYCFEKRVAESVFRAARSITLARLKRQGSVFGPQVHIFLSPDDVAPASISLPANDSWTPIDTIKTLLILVGFATWEAVDLLHQSFALRQLLVQCLHGIGLKDDESAEDSSDWVQWTIQESSRRTKLIAFCYINVHTLAYDIRPMLWSTELDLRLPCTTKRWQACGASQWAQASLADQGEQMRLQQAAFLLLGSEEGPSLIEPSPSPLGNYILLHALLQRIYIVRELSSHTGLAHATMPAEEIEAIG
jgi:hypothetical protein